MNPASSSKTNSFADFLLLASNTFGPVTITCCFFRAAYCHRAISPPREDHHLLTIAHSITLAVATLSLVQIFEQDRQPLIAASIVLCRRGESVSR